MRVLSLKILILFNALPFMTLNHSTGALLPSDKNKIPVTITNGEIFKYTDGSTPTLDYRFESLFNVIKKMEASIDNLQEKAHTWAIFQHHIESWNDGIRVLENKLDFLQRKHEEQQQQLDKFQNNIMDVMEKDTLLKHDVRSALKAESDIQKLSSSKLNSILRLMQTKQTEMKNANFNDPGNSKNNVLIKIEQRLNTLMNQVAQQKDLKQLQSLEKRNSKVLESLNELLNFSIVNKMEEFTIRLRRSNECCHSLSNELTTFTESSDILLKRIEKLLSSVSEKLNRFEYVHRVHVKEEAEEEENMEEEEDEEDRDINIDDIDVTTDMSNEYTEIEDTDLNISREEEEFIEIKSGLDSSSVSVFVDSVQDIEFVRPSLNGCHELLMDTSSDEQIDGIYKFLTPDINERERDFNERYCVFPKGNDTTGLPWTVIQNRGPYKPQENFNRSWSDYRNGFGNLYRDFWFGNEYIHRLVYDEDYELRIEMEDFNGTTVWVEYETFRLEPEEYNYNLIIDRYRGIVSDAMKYHNDKDFSTYDRRNDNTVDACCSCAMGYASGWWFDNCVEANLNGIYHETPLGHNYIGIIWELWHGDYSLKASRMMIRPLRATFTPKGTKSITSDP